MGRRQKDREMAMFLIYQADIRQENIDLIIAENEESGGIAGRKAGDFAVSLARGVMNCLDVIDPAILSCARNWSLDRMAAVDRAVLRLAAFELVNMPDIPLKVSINEAIELAKKYSTARSGEFVNGVLDSLALSIKSGNDMNGS